MNAYAERFVLSIKSECLDRIVPLGERHLRRAIVEYLAHYHGDRNHRGVGNVLLRGSPEPANENKTAKHSTLVAASFVFFLGRSGATAAVRRQIRNILGSEPVEHSRFFDRPPTWWLLLSWSSDRLPSWTLRSRR